MYCSNSSSSVSVKRASSHAYCRRKRENSDGEKSTIVVVRRGSWSARIGNPLRGNTPLSTRPMSVLPESRWS